MVVLIITMLAYVNFQAQRFVGNLISADLVQGRTRIESTIQDRFADLTLTARLVASFPALKAILAGDGYRRPSGISFLPTNNRTTRPIC